MVHIQLAWVQSARSPTRRVTVHAAINRSRVRRSTSLGDSSRELFETAVGAERVRTRSQSREVAALRRTRSLSHESDGSSRSSDSEIEIVRRDRYSERHSSPALHDFLPIQALECSPTARRSRRVHSESNAREEKWKNSQKSCSSALIARTRQLRNSSLAIDRSGLYEVEDHTLGRESAFRNSCTSEQNRQEFRHGVGTSMNERRDFRRLEAVTSGIDEYFVPIRSLRRSPRRPKRSAKAPRTAFRRQGGSENLQTGSDVEVYDKKVESSGQRIVGGRSNALSRSTKEKPAPNENSAATASLDNVTGAINCDSVGSIKPEAAGRKGALTKTARSDDPTCRCPADWSSDGSSDTTDPLNADTAGSTSALLSDESAAAFGRRRRGDCERLSSFGQAVGDNFLGKEELEFVQCAKSTAQFRHSTPQLSVAEVDLCRGRVFRGNFDSTERMKAIQRWAFDVAAVQDRGGMDVSPCGGAVQFGVDVDVDVDTLSEQARLAEQTHSTPYSTVRSLWKFQASSNNAHVRKEEKLVRDDSFRNESEEILAKRDDQASCSGFLQRLRPRLSLSHEELTTLGQTISSRIGGLIAHGRRDDVTYPKASYSVLCDGRNLPSDESADEHEECDSAYCGHASARPAHLLRRRRRVGGFLRLCCSGSSPPPRYPLPARKSAPADSTEHVYEAINVPGKLTGRPVSQTGSSVDSGCFSDLQPPPSSHFGRSGIYGRHSTIAPSDHHSRRHSSGHSLKGRNKSYSNGYYTGHSASQQLDSPQVATPGTPRCMFSSECDASSHPDCSDDGASRFTSATETTAATHCSHSVADCRGRGGRGGQRRLSHTHRRALPHRMSAASSFSSISDSTSSLSVVRVQLNMEKVKFLGISVVGQSNKSGDGGIYVGSVVKGGAVAEDGRIEPGDLLLEVNGISFEEMSNDDAVEALRTAVQSCKPIILAVGKCWDPNPSTSVDYLNIRRQEPCQPLDPSAWVAHTNAVRNDLLFGNLVSVSSLQKENLSLKNAPLEMPLNLDEDLLMVAEQLAQPDSGLKFSNQTWPKHTATDSFKGSELIRWLLSRIDGPSTFLDAKILASRLLQQGFIQHTKLGTESSFSEQSFYLAADACTASFWSKVDDDHSMLHDYNPYGATRHYFSRSTSQSTRAAKRLSYPESAQQLENSKKLGTV